VSLAIWAFFVFRLPIVSSCKVSTDDGELDYPSHGRNGAFTMASQRIPFLFGSIPARFESDYTLEESIERLGATVQSSVFHSLFEQAAVGQVSEANVSLQRVLPMVHNGFKPHFKGSFCVESGRVILDGRFAVQPATKIFLGFAFSFLAICGVIACVIFFHGETRNVEVSLGFLGMIPLFCTIAFFGQWLARNDVAWLSSRIEGALSSGGGPQSGHTGASSKDDISRP